MNNSQSAGPVISRDRSDQTLIAEFAVSDFNTQLQSLLFQPSSEHLFSDLVSELDLLESPNITSHLFLDTNKCNDLPFSDNSLKQNNLTHLTGPKILQLDDFIHEKMIECEPVPRQHSQLQEQPTIKKRKYESPCRSLVSPFYHAFNEFFHESEDNENRFCFIMLK